MEEMEPQINSPSNGSDVEQDDDFTVTIAPLINISEYNYMPMIGLATWKSSPEEVYQAVKYAINIGYRYIDCAFAYQNESEIGRAISEKISDNTVRRENLFIASKLWNTFHKKERVKDCLEKSMESLGVEYLDLYVIHWPIAFVDQGEEYFPRDKEGNMVTEDLDFIETWKGMEELYNQNLVKSIGLANFNLGQIQKILNMCQIRPSVLQVECHPYFHQKELIHFCRGQGIIVTAYTPLGAPNRPWNKPSEPNVLQDHIIQDIAQKYNKTPSQIALKFNIQRNIAVIPASIYRREIRDFLKLFDFELSREDMNKLFHCQQIRYYTYKRSEHDQNYPF